MRRPERAMLDVIFAQRQCFILEDEILNSNKTSSIIRTPIAGLLTWIVPGLGHIYLGNRVRGMICMVTITVTFWTGVAIGGVQGTIAPYSRELWFMAQLGTGGNTLAAYALHAVVSPDTVRSPRPSIAGHWMSTEIGVHYTGVAGLLNLLVILDALAYGGVWEASTRRRELPPGVT